MTEIQLHPKPLRVFEEIDGESREIEVPTPLSSFFASDRIRLNFTGTLPAIPDLHLSNFIESVLYDFAAEGVDFSQCDFKDCVIRASTFRGCKFNNNSFLMNIVVQSEFVDCSFYNFSSQGSEFRNTKFISCDLTNMLVKSAKFISCEFIECRTSNKIMEMSMVVDTKFVRTDIQVDTITSNFGITAADLDVSMVRNGRARDRHERLNPEDVESMSTAGLSSLERLRLDYFANPDLTDGSEALDESVAIAQWARIYKSPASFGDLFELFAEFLVLAYERNQVTMQPLLLLHAVTAQLTASPRDQSNYQRVAISVGGVHLMLSRFAERLLHAAEDASAICGTKVQMLVDGPLDKAYYSQLLAPWLKRGRIAITRLVPHNSPAEITFQAANAIWFLPLLAVFLATRTSLQISRLENDLHERQRASLPAAETKTVATVAPRPSKTELVSFSTGRHRKSRDYQIHVRALVSKSLLLDLKLEIGTKVAGKLKKVLRALFFD